jgi:hypothetical protein
VLTLLLGAVHLDVSKDLETVLDLLLGHSTACVRHHELDDASSQESVARVVLDGDVDLSSLLLVKLDGVGHDMEHHLVEPVDVPDHMGWEEVRVNHHDVYLDALGLDLDEKVLQ